MTSSPVRPTLVTGANGFVGTALCVHLLERGRPVRAVVRRAESASLPAGLEVVAAPRVLEGEFPAALLDGIDAVVHTAARVHVMDDTASDPLAEFRRVNVAGTLRLARRAAEAGVRRFVFVSSIKVNGERTDRDRPFTADDPPAPVDPYGISKLEAEEGLRALASGGGMEVVIIRPVLVYGPGVKGNFAAMMRWLHRGVPLPFGTVENRRSLVAVENLAHLLATCVEHPAAANRTFLVSDAHDLSTPELLRRTAAALGVKPRLLPVPPGLIAMASRMLGRQAVAQRLMGSLQVDVTATRSLLGWMPPVPIDEALRRTAAAYLAARHEA